MRLSFIFIRGDILTNALTFLLAFLDMSETWQSNVSLLSILTPNNFSQSLFVWGVLGAKSYIWVTRAQKSYQEITPATYHQFPARELHFIQNHKLLSIKS